MIPSLDWPQVVAFISAFAIACGTIYQVILKVWAPQGNESLERRENKADVLAEAMAGLTAQVTAHDRIIEALRARQEKLIDLTIELSRAGHKPEDG